MKKITLQESSRQTLEQMYKFHPLKQNRVRAHCLLLLSAGYLPFAAAAILGRSLKTIYNWMDRWQQSGLMGLYDQPGRGRKPLLTGPEREQVCQLVRDSPRRIGEHLVTIEKQWGKRISRSTLKRTLREMKLSWKRIRKWLGRLRDEEDFRMAQQELSCLRELEDKGLIELYFCDEAGFNQVPCVPYAWQERGQPIALAPAKGRNYNVLGIMRRDNYLQAYGVEGSIDSKTAIALIEGFCSEREKIAGLPPAYMVIDNAPIHGSKAFREKERDWEKRGLRLKRIPTYSPELNLIEILWRKVKYDWLPFDAYITFENLINQVDHILQNIGENFVINFE